MEERSEDREDTVYEKSESGLLTGKRMIVLFTATAITLIGAVACGANSDRDVSASGNELSDESSSKSLASDGPSGDELNVVGDVAATGGGLDPVCVELVLGRTATGFSDITAIERTRIFEECSVGAGEPRGERLSAGFDPLCVQSALGFEVMNFAELTPGQRQALFEQCGGDDTRQGGIGGRVGGEERPAGGFGGGEFAGVLENECVQNALAESTNDVTQPSQERLRQVLAQCSDELGLPEGGFPGGGFGGRQGGGLGRSGGGQDAPAN